MNTLLRITRQNPTHPIILLTNIVSIPCHLYSHYVLKSLIIYVNSKSVTVLINKVLAVPIKEKCFLIIIHVFFALIWWKLRPDVAIDDVKSKVGEETQENITLLKLENVTSFLLSKGLIKPFSKKHFTTKVYFVVYFNLCVVKKLRWLLLCKSFSVIL